MSRAVLFTGAGGFLAGHFSGAFADAGWRCVGISRSNPNAQAERFDAFEVHDPADRRALAGVLDRHAPELIVHLAAPASVPASHDDPIGDLEGHVGPTMALLEAIRHSGARPRFILISSAAVYGNPERLPVAETAPLTPISPYGFHKVHQELLADEYTRLYGFRCCKARVFSTYGENLRRLAVWEIARRALAGTPTVYGTGAETRDYLYAGDAGRAIVAIAENARCEGEAVNVGSGQAVTIAEVAAAIFRAAGCTAAPRFTGASPAGSPLRWSADVSALRALGFDPPPWDAGLGRTIAWIRDQR